MINHINIDDYSFLQTDDKLYLFFPEQEDNVSEAKVLYNRQNVLLLKRNQIYFVFKDIPFHIRNTLNTIQHIIFVEIKSDNKNITCGYELELVYNENIPNIDNLEVLFDADFSFLKDNIDQDDYNQFKNFLGIK